MALSNARNMTGKYATYIVYDSNTEMPKPIKLVKKINIVFLQNYNMREKKHVLLTIILLYKTKFTIKLWV